MTNRIRSTLAALTLGAALATSSAARDPTDSSSHMLQRLKSLYPATQFGAVSATPLPGIYEVVLGNQLAYVDGSGQYFLFGHLYDMKAQRDITAERKDLLARIDFAALPLDDALKEVRGNGSRVLAIFSDPDCPYCKKLEADLKALTDVTIYTFLMPLASLHPDARGKAIAVWCAAEPLKAWRSLMDAGQTPSGTECPHPIERNIALGDRLGISGTPTLVANDGRVMAGAAGLAQIDAWLSRRTEAPTR